MNEYTLPQSTYYKITYKPITIELDEIIDIKRKEINR